ncbi:MAG: right-handed parallel beta-helix repeat-containing protein, partial [Phycisphaerae bacterium]
MKRTYWYIVVTIVAVVAVSVFCLAAGRMPEKGMAGPRLPGAQLVIDASCYPSLQAAIDALPAQGGVVRLPPGTFEIDKPLKITTSDVLIEGSGTATHIKNINTGGKSALILQHSSGAENRKAELWRIRLANLRITGNEKSGHGIEARRINEIFIDGVTVSYHGGDGIRLHYCYEDPRICDSLITYNKKIGLSLIGCHDIVVASNQFEENQDAVRCIDSFNLCMTGNNLDDHLGDGV